MEISSINLNLQDNSDFHPSLSQEERRLIHKKEKETYTSGVVAHTTVYNNNEPTAFF